MRSLFCYVHTATSATPHLRSMSVDSFTRFEEAIDEVLREWPHFEALEIYDEHDRRLMLVGSDGMAMKAN